MQMNVLLIPIILSSLINQIQLSENHIINAYIINESTKIDMNYMALTPEDFLLVKSIVESNDTECKSIVTDAIGVCHYQIKACHSTCNSIPEHQKRLIRTLKNDTNVLKADIRLLEKQNSFFKYAAIIGSSLAIGASTYIILK
jgi:hypothetical protein